MAREIRPLEPGDIPELSRFLTEGFRSAPDSAFAAPDVLAWKYFDPRGGDDAPRSLIAREGDRIVGHIGYCPARFHRASDPALAVPSLHGIDWLAAEPHKAIGAHLLMHMHRYAETQYALGVSESGQRVIRRYGYEPAAQIPVWTKTLRPSHRLRAPGERPIRRALQAVRDAARLALRPGRRPRGRVGLREVGTFGAEVATILAACRLDFVFTSRDPDVLNHYLRYPRGGLSGWLLQADSRVRGFAMLGLVPRPGVLLGKVVDCVLDAGEPDLWHASIAALTGELKARGADVAECFGSTPWMASALETSGYAARHEIGFFLRDRQGLVPRDAAFHLTALEADYAYT